MPSRSTAFYLILWLGLVAGLMFGLMSRSAHPLLYQMKVELKYDAPAPADWIPFADRYGVNWRHRLIARELHADWMIRALADAPLVLDFMESESFLPQTTSDFRELAKLSWQRLIHRETVYPQRMPQPPSQADHEGRVQRVASAFSTRLDVHGQFVVLEFSDSNPDFVKLLAKLIPEIYQKTQPSFREREQLPVLSWFADSTWDNAPADVSTTRARQWERLAAVYTHRQEILDTLENPVKLLPSSVRSEELEILERRIVLAKMRRGQLQRHSTDTDLDALDSEIGYAMARFNRLLRPSLEHIESIREDLENELLSAHSESWLTRDVALIKCLALSPDCHGLLKPKLIESKQGALFLFSSQPVILYPFLMGLMGVGIVLAMYGIIFLFHGLIKNRGFAQLVTPFER